MGVRVSSLLWLEDRASKWPYAWSFADGHAVSNAPALFRPPKLSGTGPGQYWGGGPPGKTSGCCQLLLFAARQKLTAPYKLTAPKVRSWATRPLRGEGLHPSVELALGWVGGRVWQDRPPMVDEREFGG